MVMLVVIGVVVFGLAPRWLLPLATAYTVYQGSKDAKKARKQQGEAMDRQQAFESAHAARMDAMQKDQMSLANAMAFGGSYSHKDAAGNNMPVTFAGAGPQADEWTQNYLRWLQTSPDVTYNQQRSRMERDVSQGMEAAAGSMGGRGVTSGIATRRLADMAVTRARMLGGMEADRVNRQGERIGMGSQITQGLYDRALGMRQTAMGMPHQTSTQIPQMMMDRAGQTAGQAGAWGNLATSLIGYGLQSGQRPPQAPAAPVAPPPAVQVPNQFYDFKYKAPGRYGGY